MKKIIMIAIILFIAIFSINANAEEEDIIRLGIGSSLLTNCARGDFGGRLNLHVGVERYAPFELEMSYTIARGLEFILLVDVIRSRYVDWHFFDLGLYFFMDTRPFNNLNLQRNYDIVLGTGLDVRIPRITDLVIYFNVRFYFPDPRSIVSAARRGGSREADEIIDNFDISVLNRIEEYIDESYEQVLDAATDEFRGIFRDVGRSVVISVGLKWYFN